MGWKKKKKDPVPPYASIAALSPPHPPLQEEQERGSRKNARYAPLKSQRKGQAINGKKKKKRKQQTQPPNQHHPSLSRNRPARCLTPLMALIVPSHSLPPHIPLPQSRRPPKNLHPQRRRLDELVPRHTLIPSPLKETLVLPQNHRPLSQRATRVPDMRLHLPLRREGSGESTRVAGAVGVRLHEELGGEGEARG